MPVLGQRTPLRHEYNTAREVAGLEVAQKEKAHRLSGAP
jgi:hypothetical protein